MMNSERLLSIDNRPVTSRANVSEHPSRAELRQTGCEGEAETDAEAEVLLGRGGSMEPGLYTCPHNFY
jgi:hypothetical protein